MTPVRLEPTAPQSRVKHSTTEPLRQLVLFKKISTLELKFLLENQCQLVSVKKISTLKSVEKLTAVNQ